MSEAPMGDEPLEELTVYQTSTWRAARDLLRSRFADAELVTALVERDADVVVLRLDSGALVQMGVVHA